MEVEGYHGDKIHVGDYVEDVREEGHKRRKVVNMLKGIVGVMKHHNVTYLPAEFFRRVKEDS